MLQDLAERRRGHRNVSEEEVEHALNMIDTNGDGLISTDEWVAYFTSNALANANREGEEARREGQGGKARNWPNGFLHFR